MKFQGQAVLVYLEEDNITRAYFRIRPLLTVTGPVSQEELNAFPDEGYLRIVPDKNEQHTFKDRMRTMCGLCLLDLRNQPAEANKIRTNKNYSPTRGELNQFIVYSDAVQAIHPGILYQVVSENEIEKAYTPEVYVRSGANMQGPIAKGQPIADATQLPPDSNGLYSVSVNGQELLFYWPQPAKDVPASETPKTATALPEETPALPAAPVLTAMDKIQQLNENIVSETANKLQPEASAPVFTPKAQQPLSGTRLYQPPQKQTNFRRAHNALMETVDQQRYAAKFEAPGAVLCDCSALKDVENPICAFKRSLQEVCQNEENCRHAVEAMLAYPGMKQALINTISDKNSSLTVTAMQRQLQELEAERLMLLMQLDDAKKNVLDFRSEALAQATNEEKAALDALDARKAALVNELKEQQESLLALNTSRMEAQELLEKAATDGENALLLRKTGNNLSAAQLCERLECALKAAGFVCEEGDALSLLTAFALSTHALYFSSFNDADALLLADVFAKVFDAPASLDANSCHVKMAPGGNTPAFIRANPRKDCTAVYLRHDIQNHGLICHMTMPGALFHLEADPLSVPKALPAFSPVSVFSLQGFLQESTLSEEAVQAINALRTLGSKEQTLPLACVQMAFAFMSATQNVLKGGISEAIDRAVSLFILPYYLHNGIKKETLEAQLTAMPRSLKIWNDLK